MSAKEAVARNLVKYRKEKGLTQKQLAKILGVKNTSISNWENGVSSLDIELLAKICEVLNVSVTDMYEDQSIDLITNNSLSIGGIDENGNFVDEFSKEESLKIIGDMAKLPKEAIGDLKVIFEFLDYKYNKRRE